MKKLIWILVLPLAFSFPALAQQRGGQQRGGAARPSAPEVGGGHIPAHGPTAAPARPAPAPGRAAAAPEKAPARNFTEQPGHPNAPHVDAKNDRWVGHDTGKNDANYHLDKPWEHGHFPGAFGAGHVYRLGGGNPQRFGFDGFFFGVAPADLGFCNDWLWDSDDIVIYAD